jgi:hypothetical protein
MKAGRIYRTDETIPNSGIYRVLHLEHRLPHEVTLLRDEQFPRCAKCRLAVRFELLQAAEEELDSFREGAMRIALYELPELASEADEGRMAI